MPHVFEHLRLSGYESPHGGERLAEAGHDEVNTVCQPEVRRGAPTARSQDAEGVGIVDHHPGTVSRGDGHQSGEVHDVTFHAEHAVGGHQATLSRRELHQDSLEVAHGVVAVRERLAEGQGASVDDRRVVLTVAKHDIPATDQARENSQVALISG